MAPPRGRGSKASAAKAGARRKQHAPQPPSPMHAALLVAFYAGLVSFAIYSFYWTPAPLPADVDAGVFSEARAKAHVAALTQTIGVRSVSMPGLQAAHHLIWGRLQELEAAAAGRDDVLVQTAFENYTGSFNFDFVGERFVNAYHNISNIILHVSRPGQQYRPAVLLVAHHDSPVASPGAGDDASNIGVMLELAGNLVAAPAERLPQVPVMFLFSGAEEPLCQSASAFMAQSAWASRAGCFINLESIGPGGSPIVFQHAGAWTIEAYARGAVHPRGAIVAQDVFDAGLVLGDTDYRQLSYRDRGGLPGIDIAYLLSGAAYHTERDTLDAIRPGVLQETGQSMAAALHSLGAVLAAAAEEDERQQGQLGGGAALRTLLAPSDHRRMFLSVAGKYMITYSSGLARVLHNVPLLLTLSAPHALLLLSPDTALPIGQAFAALAGSTGRGLATLVGSLALPAGAGALRAVISGKAMIWFAHPLVGYFTFFPLSASVLLFAWSHADYSTPKGRQLLPYHVLGPALINSLLAAGLAQLDAGIAMIFALWGGADVVMALCLCKGVTTASLLAALAAVALPIYLCCESALLLAVVLMSRMSLTGHVFVGLGDAVVGLLLGVGALSLTGLAVLPLAQAVFGRVTRRLSAGLLLGGLLLAGASSVAPGIWPYSFDMPKRLVLARMHVTEPVPGSPSGPTAAAPRMRVVNSSWVLAGADSNPVSWLVDAMGIDPQAAQPSSGGELTLIYPVSKLLDVMSFPLDLGLQASNDSSSNVPGGGDAAAQPDALPSIRLVSRGSVPADTTAAAAAAAAASGQQPALTEVVFDIVIPAPCWGTLKLGGADLAAWSLMPGQWTDAAAFMSNDARSTSGSAITLQSSSGRGSAAWGEHTLSSLVVKFTSEVRGGPLVWRVAARIHSTSGSGEASQQQQQDATARLGVELHVGHVDETPALAAMEARMPAWATLSYHATILVSKWQL